MRNLTRICVTVMTGMLATAPVRAQTTLPAQAHDSRQPATALAKCDHHQTKGADCHIHDRQTYLDMSGGRPDWRTQPHAWQEFRDMERVDRLQQNE